MSDDGILIELAVQLSRARKGDEAARAWIVEHYSPMLRSLARRRFPQRLQGSLSASDFVQDVWKSFFARMLAQAELHSEEQLRAYLERMICHKVSDAIRRHLRQKRDRTREQSLSSPDLPAEALADRQADPERVVAAQEELERLADDYDAKNFFDMLGSGMTKAEIARELGVNVRTVHRLLEDIREREQDRFCN